MTRRAFITLLGGAAAWPLAARAQQSERVRRIGVLMGTARSKLGESYLATFLRRLEELKWVQDRSARIEVRWWTAGADEMRPVVAELLAFAPDVVMVFSNLALALLKSMAGNIPIVFVGVGDPIVDGFVTNLAHPGGNITGLAANDSPIGGKLAGGAQGDRSSTDPRPGGHASRDTDPSGDVAIDQGGRTTRWRRGRVRRGPRCSRN